ncbi:hypothetical protein [Ferruginibacter sp.]|nr:hypothetical protein [Ferruginibacter sp.]
MKKTLLLLLLSIFALSIFAQPDSLLKKFKYRIDNLKALNFNFSGSSQFNERDLGSGRQKNGASSGSLGATYFITKSTDRILLTGSASMNGIYLRSKAKDPTITNTNKSFFSTPRVVVLNKWFAKNIFTELGADISGDFFNSKETSTAIISVLKNNQTQYATELTMGIGKGRLENVTDMQNALWLYKELIKVDRLGAILSADDLLALGRSITKGNNTRVLDSRKRTQFLLTTVDNYLQQKGAISKTDITYFSNLNDILFFAFNSPRFAGTEKFIRLTPSIKGSNINQVQNNGIDKFEHNFTSQSVILSSGFKKYKPVNLIHQNNYGASLKLAYISGDLTNRYFTNGIITNEIKGKTIIKQAGANLFYGHAIYPNTRTIINFNLQSEFGYQDINPENFYTATNLFCGLNYFISYRTRLNCNVSAYYQRNMYSIDRYVQVLPNTIQLSAAAGLEISL